jgi:hypothetical protein
MASRRSVSAVAPAGSTAGTRLGLCRTAGIKRSTLAQQLVRGGLGGDADRHRPQLRPGPVRPLANSRGTRTFRRHAGADKRRTPEPGCPHLDILKLLVRAQGEGGARLPGGPPEALIPFPHRNSVRAWIEAIDPGD